MADNTQIDNGTTGDIISTDDLGGVKVQRVKVQHGADGSATDVSGAAPLPVTLSNTGANATPVKVDNSAVTEPISASSLPLPSGASTSAKQDGGNTSVASIDSKTPPLGQALAGSSAPVVLPAAQVSALTPPTSVGVNNFPSTQAVSAASLPLPIGAATAAKQPALGTAGTPSTDVLTVQGDSSGTALPVQEKRSGTSTLSNVASSATSVSLLASNANRRQAMFFNDSTQVLYLKLGATASNTSFTVQLAAGGYYELPQPIYTGAIDGIWASANGNVRITELT